MSTGWVKLPRQESPAFRRLPLVARGLAALMLKLSDRDGWIDLGTRDVGRMPGVVKRALGGDRYDLAALRRHLPKLLDASAFWVKGSGLQAGEWAGFAAPDRSFGAALGRDASGMRAGYERDASGIGAACERDASGIGPPNPARSGQSAPVERKKERQTDIREPLKFSDLELVEHAFTDWRRGVGKSWVRDWKADKHLERAALQLAQSSRDLCIPLGVVVRLSLRGFSRQDAPQKQFGLGWWSYDPTRYLDAAEVSEWKERHGGSAPEPEPEGMSLEDARANGLLGDGGDFLKGAGLG